MNTDPVASALPGERPRVALSISIDTEEDNWTPTLQGVTVRNIGELPKLADLFRSLGVRATYFVTYQVAAGPESAPVIRALHESGSAEIGAHLHPWNTPPSCGLESRVSMLRSYPPEAQRQKLERLLEEFDRSLGLRPTAFRAGRFGLGRSTVEALIQTGFRVDSSVTPLLSWEGDGGPSFIGAPTKLYRLDGTSDVRSPVTSGPLVEVPITVGFTRYPPAVWPRVARNLTNRWARRFRVLGFASRAGYLRRVLLSPETHGVDDMLRVSRLAVDAQTPFLHLFFHSSSLFPGLTPFASTRADVDRLYDSVRRYVEGLREIAEVSFCTLSEAAERFAPSASQPSRESPMTGEIGAANQVGNGAG